MTREQQRKHDRVSQVLADEAEVVRLGIGGWATLARRRARNARKRRAKNRSRK